MFRVALAESPLASVTLTLKVFRPTSEPCGVPESAPFAATESHEGPLTLLKVRVSPKVISSSFALVARDVPA